MWRDNVELLEQQNINFLITHGAIGDMVSSLPAIAYARKVHTKKLNLNVWVARYQVDLVRHLLGPNGINVLPLDEFKVTSTDKTLIGPGSMNGLNPPIVTRNRFNMVDYAYATLLDVQCEADWQRCYPHKACLGKRVIHRPYVVIPTGATNAPSVVRPDLLQRLIEWVLDNKWLPVLVGKGTSDVVMYKKDEPHKLTITDKTDDLPKKLLAKCKDARDKTTLMELRDLCGHAEVVIGIDGGTLHLAGTTEVPIVYGCTRVDPKHRPIIRHNERNWRLKHVTPRDLTCSGCQSHWNLLYQHDFSTCRYGDAACAEQLHADDFIKAAEQLLADKENEE